MRSVIIHLPDRGVGDMLEQVWVNIDGKGTYKPALSSHIDEHYVTITDSYGAYLETVHREQVKLHNPKSRRWKKKPLYLRMKEA